MSLLRSKLWLFEALGIKLDEPDLPEYLRHNNYYYVVPGVKPYIEYEPSVKEWLASLVPSRIQALQYICDLFPFMKWIPHYNLKWFLGDLVAGLTVGAVVVPQSMAYAKLAGLRPEYGLYSSFMGVMVYWFFATSKDITIGPVAVMSIVTGNVVDRASKQLPGIENSVIASSLSLMVGLIITMIGLLRLGWLVDLISLPSISAFTTGSALNIAVGQLSSLMGISGVNKRATTYKVLIDSLRKLPTSDINAALGLTSLFMLYTLRTTCRKLAVRHTSKAKILFFLSTLRSSFVILFFTFVSWLVNRNRRDNVRFKVLGTVPRGFKHAQVPQVSPNFFRALGSSLPTACIVSLIEHISIAKSFGRVNNYTINPSQELVAIGITNTLGPFLGAYPATGSFSRTAIKSAAGVRTPFAGVITGLVVLLAIYAFPAMFFYIPNASLSAVIIHAICDLITPPNMVYRFWRVSPIEALIFFSGVSMAFFHGIEDGIYLTVIATAAINLWRVFMAQGKFLGRVIAQFAVTGPPEKISRCSAENPELDQKIELADEDGQKVLTPLNGWTPATKYIYRDVFLSIDHYEGSNPSIPVRSPYPGIFIFRFSEGYNYQNANHYLDHIVQAIYQQTRRTNQDTYLTSGDHPWNDPAPRKSKAEKTAEESLRLPTLKALILDFESVNQVDVTSVQALVDLRNQFMKYAAPNVVEWHFSSIKSRWTKRALASVGFGRRSSINGNSASRTWRTLLSVSKVERDLESVHLSEHSTPKTPVDEQKGMMEISNEHIYGTPRWPSKERGFDGSWPGEDGRKELLQGSNFPLFHIDLPNALESALMIVKDGNFQE